MDEKPKFITAYQACKVSGKASSTINHFINNGELGNIKEKKQGKRNVKQIPTERFIELCESKGIELDWSKLNKSLKQSLNDSPPAALNDSQFHSHNDQQIESQNRELREILETQYEARIAELKDRLEMAEHKLEEKELELRSERKEIEMKREADKSALLMLTGDLNLFKVRLSEMAQIMKSLDRKDGLKLMLRGHLSNSLPAYSSDLDDHLVKDEDISKSETQASDYIDTTYASMRHSSKTAPDT